jgi:hypothetical protein
MFEYKKILKKNHLEFLDNKHKRMKVVDALGRSIDILPFVICSRFLPKFQNLS